MLQLFLCHNVYGIISIFSHHIVACYGLYFIDRIPDAFGRDIEKACQSIYPLHDVFIRKVKVLKKPKFDRKLKSH